MTAVSVFLVLVIAVFAASYLPRLRDRIRAEKKARDTEPDVGYSAALAALYAARISAMFRAHADRKRDLP